MPDFHSMWKDTLSKDYQTMIHGELSEGVMIQNGTSLASSLGTFDIPYQELDLDTNTVVSSQKPRVTVWTADFPFPITRQCTVIVRNVNYVIYSIENNGEGALTLWLEEARLNA